MGRLHACLTFRLHAAMLGCRYWVADREGLDGTWVTAYGPWVEEYGGGDARLDASTVRAYISKPRLYLASVYWGLTTVATIGGTLPLLSL